MTVVDRDTFFATLWPPSSVGCPGQVPDGMQDLVWKTGTQNDTLGLSWGPSGLKRVRTFTNWGWNRAFAKLFATVPTLLIQGEFDHVVLDSRILYGDLGVAKKIFVRVQCASHMMSFKMQAMNIHRITEQWLGHAELQHVSQGQFLLDVNGHLSLLP